ncbi:glycoside hydrolase family 55 protein [Crucibulum laeve]|uniref:Glycoside hydrolase family 55 protein n=1 Tax=Crucibulum laeve TaxID=68775 RepID=A0A5C3MBL0_9AGAR|nr:glycoside hydrolase family 55 protein [Crucibulum laeve]
MADDALLGFQRPPPKLSNESPYWLELIKHQGRSAYNPDSSYPVFRNVKDFGAKGDGITDDTAAINLAISYGGRCGGGSCQSSTITPALVYFPQGTYIVTSPVIAYYYTQLIGDAKSPPCLLAAADFEGIAIIDADPYISGGGGAQWYGNTNNFFRSVRNFVIDTRRVPSFKPQGTGIHWQVAQATSLMNIVFEMSRDPNTAHQGIWMENGSGGYMGDLVFNGGNSKLVFAAKRGLTGPWIAVVLSNGKVLLPGGDRTIESWGQGNVYSGTGSSGKFVQDDILAFPKPDVLLNTAGKIFGRMHPQYAHCNIDDIVSVKDYGAKGDGRTDDTNSLRLVLGKFAHSKIIFFDAGTYIVTSTLTIPPGARIVGEAWSVIAGAGPMFQDDRNPQVVVRVGDEGTVGVAEISDIVFATVGPAPGAIVVQWNIRDDNQQGTSGMWDSHIRLGGAAGTNLELAQCPPGNDNRTQCMAAFLALHLTRYCSVYLEVPMGTWIWLADHDLDGDGTSRISIYSGRGILSESIGPVWMIGTAEHHVLYQYRLVNAKNHYMGLIQTESPYFQPSPPVPAPFATISEYNDPLYPPDMKSAWGLSIKSSKGIIIFGGGLYSFFHDYTQSCIASRNCQAHMVDVDSQTDIYIYSLSTVSATYQISVDLKGIVDEADNLNGFASTVTLWSPDNATTGRSNNKKETTEARTWQCMNSCEVV